ncbi:hypothetical protein DXU06_23045 [Bradyrhizobium elkanii]|nr:hypothetical protein BLN97_11190 [Bradyrhizobium elkanii]
MSRDAAAYWMPRLKRGMTAECDEAAARNSLTVILRSALLRASRRIDGHTRAAHPSRLAHARTSSDNGYAIARG